MDSKNSLSLSLICLFLLIAACESSVMRDFNTHMAGNDFRSARQMLENELSQNSNNAEANYLMGNVLSREKQYEEANKYFDRSLNSSSMYREHIEYLKERNYRLELNAGLDARERERFSDTARYFTYASQIFPARVEVYPTLGNAFTELENHEQAQQVYLQCLEHDAENFQCGLNLAESYFLSEDHEKAVDTALEFLGYYPSNHTFHKILAYAHLENGNYNEAVEAFNQKLEHRFSYNSVKQFANELNNLGEIYRAEPFYRICLQRMPGDQDVLSALSYIYLETGNFGLMVEANQRLVALNPENRLLKENLMLAYELNGDIDNYRALKSELGLD